MQDLSKSKLVSKISSITARIQLKPFADELTTEILTGTSHRSCVPVGYLLPPLLTSISHYMGNSKIVATDTLSESFILYTACLGNPATGKTPALKIVTNAVYELDNANGIDPKESQVANGATVEGLIDLLNDFKSVISLYDEGASFLGTMGRYNNNGASYDRSVILELFNGLQRFNRDLKSGRQRIPNPRVNLALMSHIHVWYKLMIEERESFSDGLCQRFLLAAPEPLYDIEFEDTIGIPQPKCSIVCLFYFIQKLNSIPIVYYFEDKAKIQFGRYFNGFRALCRLSNAQSEVFISALYGKCNSLLLRLCGIIQNIKYVVKKVSNMRSCHFESIKEEFKIDVEQSLDICRAECASINEETLEHAYNLLNYFNTHKLVIAGYDVDLDVPNFCLNDCVMQILQDAKDSCDLASKPIYQKLLLLNGPELISTYVQEKYRWSKDETTSHFAGLVALRLGDTIERTGGKGKKILVFIKKSIQSLQADPDVAANFISLEIDADRYEDVYRQDVLHPKVVNRTKKSIFNRPPKDVDVFDDSSIGLSTLTNVSETDTEYSTGNQSDNASSGMSLHSSGSGSNVTVFKDSVSFATATTQVVTTSSPLEGKENESASFIKIADTVGDSDGNIKKICDNMDVVSNKLGNRKPISTAVSSESGIDGDLSIDSIDKSTDKSTKVAGSVILPTGRLYLLKKPNRPPVLINFYYSQASKTSKKNTNKVSKAINSGAQKRNLPIDNRVDSVEQEIGVSERKKVRARKTKNSMVGRQSAIRSRSASRCEDIPSTQVDTQASKQMIDSSQL
jgi:hypothetical protein